MKGRTLMANEEYTIDAAERFWVGPFDPEQHLCHHMQSPSTEQEWFACPDGTEFDPDYSEFSVRIFDPRARSLSFINRTIAILPKSRLRSIYNLIGGYLEKIDEENSR
jgi:hypothetical protein